MIFKNPSESSRKFFPLGMTRHPRSSFSNEVSPFSLRFAFDATRSDLSSLFVTSRDHDQQSQRTKPRLDGTTGAIRRCYSVIVEYRRSFLVEQVRFHVTLPPLLFPPSFLLTFFLSLSPLLEIINLSLPDLKSPSFNILYQESSFLPLP